MTVEQVIGKVFHVDPHEIHDGSSRGTIEAWDSMGHLTLVLALEEQFKVSISIADAMEMVEVKKIKEILKKYGIDRA